MFFNKITTKCELFTSKGVEMLARTNDFAYYKGKHSENVAPNVM